MPTVIPESRNVIIKAGVELSMITGLALPMIVLHLIIKEYQPTVRGFFCDDENIKHPYKEETVPMLWCFFIWFVLNTLTIVLTEIFTLATRSPPEKKVVLCGIEIPWLAIELYRNLGYCVLGAATTFVLTDMSKFTVGRLRPHFLSLCNASLTDDLCNSDGYPKFVEGEQRDITKLCRSYIDKENDEEELAQIDKKLHEAQLSFMSGHSSFSFYCATYLILYLHFRLNHVMETESDLLNGIRLITRTVKPYIQFAVLVLAFWITLTRVKDYYHHPLDVTIGALVGITGAVATIHISGLAHKETAFWKSRPGRLGTSRKSAYVDNGRDWKKELSDMKV